MSSHHFQKVCASLPLSQQCSYLHTRVDIKFWQPHRISACEIWLYFTVIGHGLNLKVFPRVYWLQCDLHILFLPPHPQAHCDHLIMDGGLAKGLLYTLFPDPSPMLLLLLWCSLLLCGLFFLWHQYFFGVCPGLSLLTVTFLEKLFHLHSFKSEPYIKLIFQNFGQIFLSSSYVCICDHIDISTYKLHVLLQLLHNHHWFSNWILKPALNLWFTVSLNCNIFHSVLQEIWELSMILLFSFFLSFLLFFFFNQLFSPPQTSHFLHVLGTWPLLLSYKHIPSPAQHYLFDSLNSQFYSLTLQSTLQPKKILWNTRLVA